MNSYEQLFSRHIQKSKLSGDGNEIGGICPFHDDHKSSFSANLHKGTWYCFACGAKGNAQQFAEQVGDAHFKKNRTPKPKYKSSTKSKKPQWSQNNFNLTDEFLDYFEERGISKTTLQQNDIQIKKKFMPQVKENVRSIAFPFYNTRGEVVNVKYRDLDKNFTQIKGGKQIFYGFKTFPIEDTTAIIVEGEIDSLTLDEVDMPFNLSVPNGASSVKFLDNHREFLAQIDTFIIAVDNDEPGKVLQENLIKKLGYNKCWTVDYPNDCKDINDVYINYNDEKVQNIISEAHQVSTPRNNDELIDGHFIGEIYNDKSVPPPEIINNGILPEQSICLVGGPPKSMKTMFAFNLGFSLAAGKSFYDFEINDHYNVFYIQAEMSYYTTRDERIKPMLKEGPLEIEDCHRRFFLSKRQNFNILNDEKFSILTQSVLSTNSDVVIFDPLVSFHNQDENSNDEMQTVMETFRKLAAETDVSIILIHHSNKSTDYKSGGDTIRGASSIFGAVDTFIGMKKSSDLIVNMEFDKRYGKPLDDLCFKLNPDTCWLNQKNRNDSDGVRKRFIVNTVADSGKIKKADLRDAIVDKFDTTKQSANAWINDYIGRGDLRPGPKKRNPLISLPNK